MTLTSGEIAAVASQAFQSAAADFGLDPSRTSLTYLENPGGFVNASFSVTDGRRRVHLKVAHDPETIGALERWAALAAILSTRYRAPRILGTLWLPDRRGIALVMEHIAGQAPVHREGRWIEVVARTIADLHQDARLAERIPSTGTSFRDCYRQTFGLRFTSDLAAIREAPPPFLDGAGIAELEDYAAELDQAVNRDPAFDLANSLPHHGDLWRENVRLDPDGPNDVVILDWDDLAVGDPALDWGTLFGFTWENGRLTLGPDWIASRLAHDQRIRFARYRQASLLDQAIDSLADWIDATSAPELTDRVREEKEAVHRAALTQYRETGRRGGFS